MNLDDSILFPSGISADDGAVFIGGIYRLKSEIGFPVDMSYEICKERGWHVDWNEALCYCWLHDLLGFDNFCAEMRMLLGHLEPLELWKRHGAFILAQHPEFKGQPAPIDAVCRFVLAQKTRCWLAWSLAERESGQEPSQAVLVG